MLVNLKMLKSIIFLYMVQYCASFWPPEYKVQFNQGEEFEIVNGLDDNDDEDEMIKPHDLKEFDLEKDEAKYFRINKLSNKKDINKIVNRLVQKPAQFTKVPEESDYGINEPAYGGFFDKNGILDIEDEKNAFYANEQVKKSVESVVRQKRLELGVTVAKRDLNDSDYDYVALKAEYDAQVQRAKDKADTLKYVEVKEDESLKEAVENIVGIASLPVNCTKEEENGIGLRAVECFFGDMSKVHTKEDKLRLGRKLGKLFLIWFMVYVTIAIPCWCQKGWCCCCCRCKFCRPIETIEEAKQFLMQNPPGILNENGKRIKYRATPYEKYAQKRLQQAIMKL